MHMEINPVNNHEPAASGCHLAALLHPFGITSNNIHITTGKVLKGYRFKAFEDAWERYLPSLPAGSATKRPSATVPLPPISLAVNHMSGRAE